MSTPRKTVWMAFASILFFTSAVYSMGANPPVGAAAGEQTASFHHELRCRSVFQSISARYKAFTADQRFHWILGYNLQRKPPPFFGFRTLSLAFAEMKRLPSGLSQPERLFFNGIFHLLRNRRRVFFLMADLEREVQNKMGELPLNYENNDRERLRALLDVMSSYEKKAGIKVVEVRKPLADNELFDLLAKGETFIDFASPDLQATLGSYTAQNGHWQHTVLAHRLQLHLVLRDFFSHPEHYGRPRNFLSLYKKLGSMRLQSNLNWSRTGLRPRQSATLFSELFDSVENNASSPGFFYEYRQYWPDLIIR